MGYEESTGKDFLEYVQIFAVNASLHELYGPVEICLEIAC